MIMESPLQDVDLKHFQTRRVIWRFLIEPTMTNLEIAERILSSAVWIGKSKLVSSELCLLQWSAITRRQLCRGIKESQLSTIIIHRRATSYTAR
jgi:hypothetical protein